MFFNVFEDDMNYVFKNKNTTKIPFYVNYDKETNYSNYKLFILVPINSNTENNSQLLRQVIKTIEKRTNISIIDSLQ